MQIGILIKVLYDINRLGGWGMGNYMSFVIMWNSLTLLHEVTYNS